PGPPPAKTAAENSLLCNFPLSSFPFFSPRSRGSSPRQPQKALQAVLIKHPVCLAEIIFPPSIPQIHPVSAASPPADAEVPAVPALLQGLRRFADEALRHRVGLQVEKVVLVHISQAVLV